ncbi:hypothetical protein H2201_001660 [Coniosporium apollinis]|uniref:BAP29/BAP31 transmembrane domain-containing protein n=1 Tax=Coniosporium apollinis TaxID=61459 RepID=A0ABQ9P3T2_9PEZI|nr:hypothetical protein H2201_001660 [Coniosporium apollinis]
MAERQWPHENGLSTKRCTIGAKDPSKSSCFLLILWQLFLPHLENNAGSHHYNHLYETDNHRTINMLFVLVDIVTIVTVLLSVLLETPPSTGYPFPAAVRSSLLTLSHTIQAPIATVQSRWTSQPALAPPPNASWNDDSLLGDDPITIIVDSVGPDDSAPAGAISSTGIGGNDTIYPTISDVDVYHDTSAAAEVGPELTFLDFLRFLFQHFVNECWVWLLPGVVNVLEHLLVWALRTRGLRQICGNLVFIQAGLQNEVRVKTAANKALQERVRDFEGEKEERTGQKEQQADGSLARALASAMGELNRLTGENALLTCQKALLENEKEGLLKRLQAA